MSNATHEETQMFLEVASTDSLIAELLKRGYIVISKTAWQAITDHIRRAYFEVDGKKAGK